ncbi:MAG: hypothetical protein ACQESB_00210 [Elusimicrobiota bacterium]
MNFYYIFKLKRLLIGAVLLLVAYKPAGASSAAAFLEMGAGARPLAMGSAFTAVSGDPFSVYWNPAGIARLDSIYASLMFHGGASEKWPGLADITPSISYFSFTSPIEKLGISHSGVVSLSLASARNDDIPITDKRSDGTIIREGSFNNRETALIFSAGYPLFPDNLIVGANIKYLRQNFEGIPQASASGGDVKMGMILSLSDEIDMGLSVNSGAVLKWDNGHTDSSPMQSKLGLSYKEDIGELLNFLAAADLIQKEDMPLTLSMGGELNAKAKKGFLRNLSLRTGLKEICIENRHSYISHLNRVLSWNAGGGAEFEISDFTMFLDYSYSYDSMGSLHRFSMSFKI